MRQTECKVSYRKYGLVIKLFDSIGVYQTIVNPQFYPLTREIFKREIIQWERHQKINELLKK